MRFQLKNNVIDHISQPKKKRKEKKKHEYDYIKRLLTYFTILMVSHGQPRPTPKVSTTKRPLRFIKQLQPSRL